MGMVQCSYFVTMNNIRNLFNKSFQKKFVCAYMNCVNDVEARNITISFKQEISNIFLLFLPKNILGHCKCKIMNIEEIKLFFCCVLTKLHTQHQNMFCMHILERLLRLTNLM